MSAKLTNDQATSNQATNNKACQTIIVGAGFSGLCLAIKLLERGLNDFIILEEAGEVGGTWRENTYPGAECDIPSALYSYSFEHNADWQYKWSGQEQIFAYQKGIAEKYGLYAHIKFNQRVTAAAFNSADSRWAVTTDDGGTYAGQHLVSAVGQLHIPMQPEFDNAASFEGAVFHSANWDHSVNLQGKRVAVIGSAASALQFIPQIASDVQHLTVFQRSPNWVIEKQDRPYSRFEQWVSGRFPLVTKLYRLRIWLRGELLLLPAMRRNRISQWLLKFMSLRGLRKHIKDPALVAKLTPDYPVGAKRVLFSDDYYQALARDNVYLDTSGITRFTQSGILRSDGVEESFDVIIYGTGFKTNPFLDGIAVTGANGVSLREHWQAGAHAYLGMTTHGFPNFYMLYGPNTNLGHNSIIIMVEAQVGYIVKCIEHLQTHGQHQMDVKEPVEKLYNDEIQARLNEMAFSDVAQSWYKDGERITNNWAGSTLEYRRKLRVVNWDSYEIS